jgi:hypothetical protein
MQNGVKLNISLKDTDLFNDIAALFKAVAVGRTHNKSGAG